MNVVNLHGVYGSVPALGPHPPFMAMEILRNNTRQMEYGHVALGSVNRAVKTGKMSSNVN